MSVVWTADGEDISVPPLGMASRLYVRTAASPDDAVLWVPTESHYTCGEQLRIPLQVEVQSPDGMVQLSAPGAHIVDGAGHRFTVTAEGDAGQLALTDELLRMAEPEAESFRMSMSGVDSGVIAMGITRSVYVDGEEKGILTGTRMWGDWWWE